MRKLSLLPIALFALIAVACGSTTSTLEPTATPTSTISRGYVVVLEEPGDNVKTPDFTLPTADGGTLTLSELRGEKPLSVIFYRGFF